MTFLSTLFKSHTRSRKIDLAAIEKIFATTEQGVCPWDILKETVFESRVGNFGAEPADVAADRNYENAGGVTIENWIGLWNKYF